MCVACPDQGDQGSQLLGAVSQSFPLVMARALCLLVKQENETWLCQFLLAKC